MPEDSRKYQHFTSKTQIRHHQSVKWNITFIGIRTYWNIPLKTSFWDTVIPPTSYIFHGWCFLLHKRFNQWCCTVLSIAQPQGSFLPLQRDVVLAPGGFLWAGMIWPSFGGPKSDLWLHQVSLCQNRHFDDGNFPWATHQWVQQIHIKPPNRLDLIFAFDSYLFISILRIHKFKSFSKYPISLIQFIHVYPMLGCLKTLLMDPRKCHRSVLYEEWPAGTRTCRNSQVADQWTHGRHLGMSENGVYPQWNSHFS